MNGIGNVEIEAIPITNEDIAAGRMRFTLALVGLPTTSAMANRVGRRALQVAQEQAVRMLRQALAEGTDR